MPTVLLVPHPRVAHSKSQVSFMNIARLIYLLTLLGQAKPTIDLASVIREPDYQITRSAIKLLKTTESAQTVQQYEH